MCARVTASYHIIYRAELEITELETLQSGVIPDTILPILIQARKTLYFCAEISLSFSLFSLKLNMASCKFDEKTCLKVEDHLPLTSREWLATHSLEGIHNLTHSHPR